MSRKVWHPALRTRATELFGVEYPVVQTGMGYVSDPHLTAATANAGGLGVLSAALLSYEQLAEAVDTLHSLTDRPFGVNLRADQPDVVKRADLLIRKKVKVVSFALAPREDLVKRCKDGGLVVMPSAGARRHVEKAAAWGADAVVVQGGEGGGHTGRVPTSLLLPQARDAVDIVILAAGGYFDGRGLVSALAYGADGIAMGTRFLLTSDSPVAQAVKEEYLSKTVDDTVLTRQIDGVPQRVIRGRAIDELERASAPGRLLRAARNAVAFQRMSGTPWGDVIREGLALRRRHRLSWSQVVMAANAPMLYRTALLDGRPDVGVMATGQVVGLIDDLPSCAELLERITAEAVAVLERLGCGERSEAG
ncbi:NAD(P)H-dependent flavin oxidoreductase YrpB (nitropropane dioxygenase family) [Streptosporangium becharense]|uniref:NAD(P)H-dependent flavin oxidoreductase YrpB (Nitropropane dioxygenase family) n=1 Tax=Streptosporangium becharense TaxID=1816182 RepID=A0A7W9IBY7_9ACTN|nr:nitronate monooxygenase [Streptosporangium becharense]MBB2910694.1 NAD(P)H-dependent flavin oxidoreductase YrpB (nitropropane dioxygenase family) [Streptosporangium becharense]MBB5817389.1 NAD(P)H-dependent flavin oxidoreductase YrpB (nitropropane dioxygenase family) [Streptosporangium becharense]